MEKKKRGPRPDLAERNRKRIWTDEARKKISDANRGQKHARSDEYKSNLSNVLSEYYKTHTHHKKGSPHSPEHIRKIIAANTGRKFTEERRRNISLSTKGRKPWNWTGHSKGYPLDWDLIRDEILKRDGRACMLNKDHDLNGFRNPDVHHITGNKKDNNPMNLISLCKACHGGVHKDFEASKIRLHAILAERYGYSYD